MINKIIIFSCLSSILYRLGGIGEKYFKTWMRDWLIPLVAFIVMFFVLKIKAPWYIHLISFGLLGGFLTTYWDNSKNPIKDMIAKVINWTYPEDNFYLHGGFLGAAYLPYAICGSINWFSFSLRVLVLAIFIGGLNWIVHKLHIPFSDWIEELSRGFVIIATLLMF